MMKMNLHRKNQDKKIYIHLKFFIFIVMLKFQSSEKEICVSKIIFKKEKAALY
jgi:hypothetical protein